MACYSFTKESLRLPLIGFFVNTLVLRSQIEPGRSFIELLHATRQTCLEAYAHQDIPFEMLVDKLKPTRSMSHSPLFQVMFVLQNNETAELALPGLAVGFVETEYPVAKFDLTLSIAEQGGQFHCSWEYATDLFEAETVERMAAHFEALLDALALNPQQAIGSVPMLTEAEVRQLQAWNDTATDYPKDKTLVDLFEAQVERTPDNIAIVFEGQSLTYRQLNAQANQLAHYLLSLAKPDGQPLLSGNPLIAIAVERSLDMIIGLLAILKAGGAYVPIDPSYPAARIRYMLGDSQAPLLLTQSHLTGSLSLADLEHDCVVLCLDQTDVADQPSENLPARSTAEDLAYVIYTSGSTGMPKGVMVENNGLVNLVLAQIKTFEIDASSRILQFASFSFDASASEISTALLVGASLTLIAKETLLDTDQFTGLLVGQQITHVTLPPSFLNSLSEQGFSDLQTLVVAGETCPVEMMKRWSQNLRFINAYGPTENTVCASAAVCFPDMDAVSIGKPIANTRIYILNTQHQPQPPGIPGELCIAGAGLARGYLNRPGLTAEKFVELELFGKVERVYKTGDLARWLPDGNLEFLGRIDHQVKLRGFRIELGEIEAVLGQFEPVQEAVVSLYEADGNKRLVAYLVVNGQWTESSDPCSVASGQKEGLDIHATSSRVTDHGQLTTALATFLKSRLPDYMIPASFMILDSLPLTPNGKIDRKALPAPEFQATETYEAPRSDIEGKLARIWCQLLKLDSIGIHENFFELGGDSILSIQAVARARQSGLQLTPKDLFEHQTIAQLARVVGFGVATDAEQGLVTGTAPLTPIQHWLLNRQAPECWHFNQSVLLEVPSGLNTDALRLAFAAVIAHHDALRSRFPLLSGGWQQAFAGMDAPIPFSIERLDAAHELTELTLRHQQSLNLEQGPVTRLVFIQLPDSARLFWCIHHMAVDGVSWRILQEDLHTAYQQQLAGQAIRLPAKTSSFKAWAERLASYAHTETLNAQLPIWQSLPDLPLPVDHPSGANRLEHRQDITIRFSAEETAALLREVPSAYNTRINDVLLTALALALATWTGNPRQLVALEGHGRVPLFEDIDLSRTVGWFTTVHPVLLALPAHTDNPGEALKAIKEQLRLAPDQGIGYGLLAELMGHTLGCRNYPMMDPF